MHPAGASATNLRPFLGTRKRTCGGRATTVDAPREPNYFAYRPAQPLPNPFVARHGVDNAFLESSGYALFVIFALSANNDAELAPREVRGPRLNPFPGRH
eukprot:10180240-Alexandrium_andersonii.AAC.1